MCGSLPADVVEVTYCHTIPSSCDLLYVDVLVYTC